MSVRASTVTCAHVGANVVTLTVTDVNGNTSTCTSTVTVQDNVPPVALCQNVTVQLDAEIARAACRGRVKNVSTDDCAIATMSVTPSTFTCANVGVNVVTLTGTEVN